MLLQSKHRYRVKSARGTSAHTVEVFLDPTLASTVSVVQVKLQGGYEKYLTCVNTPAGLADGATAQNVKNGSLFYYVIDGTSYSPCSRRSGNSSHTR